MLILLVAWLRKETVRMTLSSGLAGGIILAAVLCSTGNMSLITYLGCRYRYCRAVKSCTVDIGIHVTYAQLGSATLCAVYHSHSLTLLCLLCLTLRLDFIVSVITLLPNTLSAPEILDTSRTDRDPAHPIPNCFHLYLSSCRIYFR